MLHNAAELLTESDADTAIWQVSKKFRICALDSRGSRLHMAYTKDAEHPNALKNKYFI